MGWGELSLKERFFEKTSILFILIILFFGIQGGISLFNKNFAPPMDLFAATGIILVVFILHLMKRFNPIVPILLLLGFVPHLFGLYKVFQYNGEHIQLYGSPQFNYHYDWFVHAFGVFCFSIVFCLISYPYFKKGFKSKLLIFVLILFFMTGLGAFNECLEYVGFDVFGFGEGFLEFGAGDSSPRGGPWENASMDMINNMLGGVVGISLFLLLKKRKESAAH